MTLAFASPLRNARADAITTFVGASGKFRFFTGPRPLTGAGLGSAVLLAECICSVTFAPPAAFNKLTVSAVANDASINADGTPEWFRLVTAANAFVLDGSVTVTGGGGDITTPNPSWVQGEPLSVSSIVWQEGNP
jgi:hypothetical protein